MAQELHMTMNGVNLYCQLQGSLLIFEHCPRPKPHIPSRSNNLYMFPRLFTAMASVIQVLTNPNHPLMSLALTEKCWSEKGLFQKCIQTLYPLSVSTLKLSTFWEKQAPIENVHLSWPPADVQKDL